MGLKQESGDEQNLGVRVLVYVLQTNESCSVSQVPYPYVLIFFFRYELALGWRNMQQMAQESVSCCSPIVL
jgi:hypothetical protein